MEPYMLKVSTGECRIVFGKPFTKFSALIEKRKTLVIVDRNVLAIYGEQLADHDVIAIDPGEKHKSLTTVGSLYREFMARELDRSCFVVGFGGGMVCDVVGFAASTYQRGLPFGFVPTTLLAQVDAALGGKNGVNLDGYKNLVGVIRQPRFVLIDPSLLETLPEREVPNGMTETIKHAAIGDRNLFAALEQNIEKIMELQRPLLDGIIQQSVRVKLNIVKTDDTEKGKRRLLNFGHTVGHALEKTSGLPHGESVAVGMAAAARIAVQRGLLEEEDLSRLLALLQRANLPIAADFDRGAIVDAIRKDKKRQGDSIYYVLLTRIGRAIIDEIPLSEIEGALHA